MRKDFTVHQLFNMILESDESKPKRGKNAKDNTSANKSAIKDITSETDKLKGGKKESKPVFGQRENKGERNDLNSTTFGYRFDSEPSDHWKARVRSIALGYAGVDHEKNASKEDFKKEGDFEGNKKFYDQEKNKVKEIEKSRQEEKSAGLKASKMPKEKFKSKTAFNENKLVFNKTFLTEQEVLESIPEEYQTPGNRFIVEDASHNKYIVECKNNSFFDGFLDLNVTKKVCSSDTLNETVDRFAQLSGYSTKTFQSGVSNYREKTKCDDVKYMLEQMRSLQPQVDTSNIPMI